MYRLTLAMFAALLFLSYSAQAQADRPARSADPHLDHCNIFLFPFNAEAYAKCVEAQGKPANPQTTVGILCEVISWSPGGNMWVKSWKYVTGTVCPPNPIGAGRRQAVSKVPCSGGMVRNGSGICQCPAGTSWTTGQRRCMAACPSGQGRDASGTCRAPQPVPNPQPPTTPHYDPPPVPPGSCSSGGPNSPAYCRD